MAPSKACCKGDMRNIVLVTTILAAIVYFGGLVVISERFGVIAMNCSLPDANAAQTPGLVPDGDVANGTKNEDNQDSTQTEVPPSSLDNVTVNDTKRPSTASMTTVVPPVTLMAGATADPTVVTGTSSAPTNRSSAATTGEPSMQTTNPPPSNSELKASAAQPSSDAQCQVERYVWIGLIVYALIGMSTFVPLAVFVIVKDARAIRIWIFVQISFLLVSLVLFIGLCVVRAGHFEGYDYGVVTAIPLCLVFKAAHMYLVRKFIEKKECNPETVLP